MKNLVILSFFFVLLSCCGNGRRFNGPFRWPAISPAVDSVNLKLEYDFANYEPYEILESDVRSFRRIASGFGDDPGVAIRTAFWEGRLYQRLGRTDSAYKAFRKAYELSDSGRHTYEFYRLRGLLRQFERVSGGVVYRQLDEEMRYYQSVGDKPMSAVTYINMGTNLYHIGEYERSLEYMQKANEINTALGFTKMVSKNTINIANIEFSRNNEAEGRRILLDLLDSDDLKGDSTAVNLINRNFYAHTGEVKWLLDAYAGVERDSGRRDLQGLYTALLSRHYFDSGKPDSGLIYSDMAMACIPSVEDYDHRAMILDAYATALELRGHIDSALQIRKQMELYIDSASTQMQRDDVLRMSNVREVQLAIAAERERAQRMKLNYLGIIFIVVAVAGVIFFLFYRRYQRDQIASRDSRLQIEKEQRHLLALTLAMEEKNNTFQSIVDEIGRMRKEGKIASPEAAIVQNIVKMHLAGDEERDSFRRMFITVNPEFVQRLQQRWPDLSESYVKLATYIYLGLDNSQIARLLVIRPESVKQARWRLRKQLGLEKDESLDEVIRSLV